MINNTVSDAVHFQSLKNDPKMTMKSLVWLELQSLDVTVHPL